MEGWRVKRFHGPSVGGWIGILYLSLWVIPVVSGVVVHASSLQGFTTSVALSVLAAGVLWFLMTHVPHRPDE
jgi:hypothetical protein